MITRLNPTYGPTSGGNTVAILGSDFTGATSVTFGGVAATNVTVVSDAQLNATAPAGTSGYATVTVTNPVGSTSTTSDTQYLYADDPVISAVSPSSGPNSGGTPVTITGSGFTVVTGVTFGFAPATSFTVVSDSELTAVVPPGSDGNAYIYLDTPVAFDYEAGQYTYTAAPPVISSVSPSTGLAGTRVTITGTGLAGLTGVAFGSAAATNLQLNTDTSVQATVPAGSGTVDVTATTADGTSATSAADQFTYGGPPVLTGIQPGYGTVVPAANVTVNSVSQLTFNTPPGAPGTATVTATDPNGTSAPLPSGFSYQPPPYPVVSAVSPNSAPTAGGTTVTLTGSGFNGVTSVKFGSTAATRYTVNSSTSITAVAPAGTQGNVGVSVTTHFGTGNSTFIYVAPPTVTSVSPTSGSTAGGTTVTVTGTDFEGAVASFGSLPFTGVTGVSFGRWRHPASPWSMTRRSPRLPRPRRPAPSTSR